MSNLVQRTLFGAIYVAVVVAAILVHPLAFAGVFIVVSTLAVREWHLLLEDDRHIRWIGMLLNILLFVTSIMLCATFSSPFAGYFSNMDVAVLIVFCLAALYVSLVLGSLLSELLLSDRAQPAKHWGDLLSGQAMVAIPFACMIALLSMDKWLLLAVFVLLWVNDTAAYCVGSLTAQRKNGNHKMAPYISPKKSWEGLIGGALFTIAAALLLAHCGWLNELFGECSTAKLNIIAAGFGLVAVVGGTLGDLMESLLKRSIGVKDSGKFLPGHGGVLDRFDSLLLAVPFLLMYCFMMAML